MSITFTPTAAGTRTGTLTITGDNTNGSQIVNLTGTGQSSTKTLSLSTTLLTYPGQNVSTTSASQSVTITSVGTVTVNLSPIAAPTGDYAISGNTCGATLAPTGTCSVSITFTPTATGTRTGTLTIDDDAAGNPQTVNLTGAGQTQLLSVNTTLLTYPGQNVNSTSAAQSVTINNTGTATVNPQRHRRAHRRLLPSARIHAETTLASGANCSVSITFTPTATGTRTGTFTVTSNATNSPQTVNLTGLGQTKLLSFSTNLITFPGQLLNTTSSAAVGNHIQHRRYRRQPEPHRRAHGRLRHQRQYLRRNAGARHQLFCIHNLHANDRGHPPRRAHHHRRCHRQSANSEPHRLRANQTAELRRHYDPHLRRAERQHDVSGSIGHSLQHRQYHRQPQRDRPTHGRLRRKRHHMRSDSAGRSNLLHIDHLHSRPRGHSHRVLTVTGDATNSPQTINLTGTGQTGLKTITQNFTSFTYQAQNVGSTSNPQNVTFTSTGNTTVNIAPSH